MAHLILGLWFTLASFLQTGIGFGLPIIAMMLLVGMFPYNTAIAVCQCVALANTIYLTTKYRKSIDYKLLMPLLVPSVVIGVITTIFAFKIETQYLELFLGVFFVILALYFLFFKEKIKYKPNKLAAWLLGIVNGAINGFFGIGGPLAVFYVFPQCESKEKYLGTISLYFTVCNIINVAIRIMLGALSFSLFSYFTVGWLGVFVGVYLAGLVFKRVDGEKLKTLVYLFVLLNGMYMIYTHYYPI